MAMPFLQVVVHRPFVGVADFRFQALSRLGQKIQIIVSNGIADDAHERPFIHARASGTNHGLQRDEEGGLLTHHQFKESSKNGRHGKAK
jgi:hypothetical protein